MNHKQQQCNYNQSKKETMKGMIVYCSISHNLTQKLKKFHHSFIHSGYIYSTSSTPLLLRGTPHTARILCRSFMPKHHRQLRVKDLPKVPTGQPERDSNPR